jgi:hypothetical protein
MSLLRGLVLLAVFTRRVLSFRAPSLIVVEMSLTPQFAITFMRMPSVQSFPESEAQFRSPMTSTCFQTHPDLSMASFKDLAIDAILWARSFAMISMLTR